MVCNKNKINSKNNLSRGDIVLIPSHYLYAGGMKGIILDLYYGIPDENDDIEEHCRIMLEDGTFENIETKDLTLLLTSEDNKFKQ